MDGSLFRPQAVEFQRTRFWAGTTAAPPPKSWWLAGFLAAVVVTAIVFLACGTYARKETVYGYVTPIGGVAKIVPPARGLVATVDVMEGDVVTPGQRLLAVRSERQVLQGWNVDAAVLNRLTRKRDALAERLDLERRNAELQQRTLAEAVDGLGNEIKSLAESLTEQRERCRIAGEQLEAIRSTTKQGITSQTEFKRRQDDLLAKQQVETDLRRQINAKAVEFRDKQRALETLKAKTADNLAQIQTVLADAEANLAEAQAKLGYVLTAPIQGRVTAVQVSVGTAIDTTVPVLIIVPEGATLQASLLVPARAAGFIAPGQTVRVAYDAYPSQRFGIYPGTVASVSRSLLKPNEALGPMTPKEPSYLVTVRLERQTITAYGQEMPLRPDMTLKANVVLERRSLIQWLFDPLLSAARERT